MPSGPPPPNDRGVTHPQAWITLWITYKPGIAGGKDLGLADAYRQRVDMKKPTQMMPKPIARFQYWDPPPSGIGYFELET